MYRLDDNWYLVYSPEGQTIAITCPPRQAHKPHKFITKGISQFQRPTGCQTELTNHFFYSDSSISSDYGLEHIELHDIVSLNIPNVSPKAIMSEMIKDGLYRPTMNNIIEAHEHQEDISNQTSVSMIVWIVFSIVLIFIIAFLSYTFHYLYIFVPLFPLSSNSKTAKSYLLLSLPSSATTS